MRVLRASAATTRVGVLEADRIDLGPDPDVMLADVLDQDAAGQLTHGHPHHVVEQQAAAATCAKRRGSWAPPAGLLGDIPPRDTDNRELVSNASVVRQKSR